MVWESWDEPRQAASESSLSPHDWAALRSAVHELNRMHLRPLVLALGYFSLGALGWLSAAIARKYVGPAESTSLTSWRAAALIALARLTVLYGAFPFLGAKQLRPLGISILLLVMGSAGVEIRLAWAAYGPAPVRPSLLLTALIMLSSIPLGFAWSWIRTRRRSGRAA